jgi:hypothetical protein
MEAEKAKIGEAINLIA